MKKFLFLAIAATAFASCSQDEVMEVAEKQAIQFGESFVGNATRAIDPSHTANNINAFKVWGTLTGNNSAKVNLFNEVLVERDGKNNGEAFKCAQTEYWVPNASYNFAAVANYTSVTAPNGLPETITFNYSDGKTDLLYTKTTNAVTTDASATPSGALKNGIVNFTFDHLLSKLQFRFENNATSTNHIFRVKNIQISGLPTKGVYTVGNTTPWAMDSDNANTGVASFGAATNATTTSSTTAVDIKKGSPITSNDARLVIPNSNTLTITFVKELYLDANADGKAVDSELIYSDANLTGDKKCTEITLSNKTFEANGNYVLVVKLTSGNKIEFTVEDLNDWTEESSVSVN